MLLGGITVEKLDIFLWGVFSYFHNKVPPHNEQPFLPFVILTLYFCSYLSFLTFSYILLYFYYS